MKRRILLTVLVAAMVRAFPAATPVSSDWPQWRGPNRDGVVPSGPKLLDSWPKAGPPLLWKSEWIPSCEEGGVGHPVVAGGRVFVYSNAKRPLDGGDGFRFVTDDLLARAGWIPDLPEALAKKLEEAWAAKSRPAPNPAPWVWWDPAKSKKSDVEALLAKSPELSKYIQDFLAALDPQDAAKYGDAIRRRLCIETPNRRWLTPEGLSWATLVKLSKLRDTRFHLRREWEAALAQVSREAASLIEVPTQPPGALLGSGRHFCWDDVYTMFDSVYCLDAATGKTLWKKDFLEDRTVAFTNPDRRPSWVFNSLGASGTPAIWGGKCYVVGALGLYCFSVSDGTLLWQAKGEPLQSEVLVADGVAYDGACGCAYDAEDGKLLWQNPLWPKRWPALDYCRWNPPLLWSSGGVDYIITTDGGLSMYCCLELKTGKVLWTLKAPVGLFTTIRGDYLITQPAWGGSATRGYKLTPAGAEPLWKKGYLDGPGDCIYQDRVYMLDRCVDRKTGETSWRSKIGIDSICPLLLADGQIIAPLGSSHQITKGWGGGYSLVMFKATPEKYIETGRFNPHACHMCSPALADGKLYLRLFDALACYDLREHGVYLDGVAAAKDTLTFRFKQTGGGLVAKNGSLEDVLIAAGGEAPKPARAKIDGENLVVDVVGAALPFAVSYPGAKALSGQNGQPLPAFSWNMAHLLRQRKCFENTIMLTSDHLLDPEGGWTTPGTFSIAGAKVTAAELDPACRNVSLTTDKTWKPGDSLRLTYACYPVAQGEPRRETLSFTVAEPQRAAAQFVKIDATTSGNWKGVYGADGAVIPGDNTSTPPEYAMVAEANKSDQVPWAPNRADTRYPQTWANAKVRSVTGWHAQDEFDISVEITDGREHQVAVYCVDMGNKTVLKVEPLDGDTMTSLASQTIQDYNRGKYVVWNLKGRVVLRLTDTNQQESTSVMGYGVFFDPPAK